MLSVWAYVRYVEESKLAGAKRRFFYVWSLVLFALGLMAKPMLVTLPFVLLLLDYWPLQRAPFSLVRLVVEKILFVLAAAAACVLTVIVAGHGGAVASMSRVPFASRLDNAVVSYARYVGKTFWPSHLAAFYPYQMHWMGWAIAGSAALLVMWSAARYGALSHGGGELVLVSGHAAAGQRIDSRRLLCDGGPVHLFVQCRPGRLSWSGGRAAGGGQRPR